MSPCWNFFEGYSAAGPMARPWAPGYLSALLKGEHGAPFVAVCGFSRGVVEAGRSDVGFVTPLPDEQFPRLRRAFIAHQATQGSLVFRLFAAHLACLSWDRNILLRYYLAMCISCFLGAGVRLTFFVPLILGSGAWLAHLLAGTHDYIVQWLLVVVLCRWRMMALYPGYGTYRVWSLLIVVLLGIFGMWCAMGACGTLSPSDTVA